ncbi:MAG: glucokinase [Thermoleophilaceae bacterium]|jgi:glucokinase|nr:glucokinase [Thermoleophilaceae bacterium]
MPCVAAAASDPNVIGVDVGGTKVAAARIEGAECESRVEQPTELDSSEGLIDQIEAVIREVMEKEGEPGAVGIGLPSQIDFSTGTVVASVNIPLEGVPLGRELGERLSLPVHVDNDANCAALAEAHFVEGGPAHHLVMYTLGTGVGGGVIIDHSIFRGATGLGAELGHQVIDWDGPDCPGACPNRGCLEALCSGLALERDATEFAQDHRDSRLGKLLAESGKVRGRDVVAAARDDDEGALKLLERLGTYLGVGLSGAINTFEPEYIVIGGGLSQGADFFLDRAREEANARALPALADRVKIQLAQGGPKAGLIGAGLLAAQELRPKKGDTAGATTREGVR